MTEIISLRQRRPISPRLRLAGGGYAVCRDVAANGEDSRQLFRPILLPPRDWRRRCPRDSIAAP